MLWKSQKSEREDSEIAENFSKIVDALRDRQVVLKYLALCSVGNLLVWIVAIVFAERVYDAMSYVFPDKIAMVILGVPFGCGLFITYCLLRLKMPAIEDSKQLDSDLMASYAYQSASTKRWLVWLFSIVGGVLNVVLLILANMYFADRL